MPIRFSDLARDTKGASIDVGGGDAIHFEFRHNLITPAYMHTLYALQAMDDASPAEQEAAIRAVCEQVARLVVEWDVLDEDDVSMYPLTVARLLDFPLVLLLRILNQCVAEMQPGEASAPGVSVSRRPSGATSSPTARSARRRTTTR